MIFGHGIDLIEISRIEGAMKNKAFTKKVFTSNEISYCEARKNKYYSYAVRFAAKEAFVKALGIGLEKGIKWTDIEIINDQQGKPEIFLSNTAKSIFHNLNLTHAFVSLSHTQEQALASVILEKL